MSQTREPQGMQVSVHSYSLCSQRLSSTGHAGAGTRWLLDVHATLSMCAMQHTKDMKTQYTTSPCVAVTKQGSMGHGKHTT